MGRRSAALDAACQKYIDYIRALGDRDEWDEISRAASQFVEQAVLVAQELQDSLARLDRTPGFIVYVSLPDADDSDLISLARRTVPADVFERVFPDVIARERAHDEIARTPIDYQVRFWAQTYEALALHRVLAVDTTGLDYKQSYALDALKALGASAVPTMLDLIERYAADPDFTIRGSKEFDEFGAFTREAWLTHCCWH